MAGGICRMGDTGMGGCTHASHAPLIPFPYTTVFSVGTPNVLTNGLPTIVMGAVGLSSCGHPTVALLASTTVMANSIGVHRMLDTGANFGPYIVNLASTDTIANNNDGG